MMDIISSINADVHFSRPLEGQWIVMRVNALYGKTKTSFPYDEHNDIIIIIVIFCILLSYTLPYYTPLLYRSIIWPIMDPYSTSVYKGTEGL